MAIRFPRLYLCTTARNATTGRRLMLEWGWYDYTARLFWCELLAWLAWQVAMRLPRHVALLAFVRVYAATTEAPGPEYIAVYRAWEQRRDLQPRPRPPADPDAAAKQQQADTQRVLE